MDVRRVANRPGRLNNEVIITCPVTGAGDTVGKHPDIPVTPAEIAASAIAAGRTVTELERLRDDCLIAIMQALRRYEIGAGRTLAEDEERRLEAARNTTRQGD